MIRLHHRCMEANRYRWRGWLAFAACLVLAPPLLLWRAIAGP